MNRSLFCLALWCGVAPGAWPFHALAGDQPQWGQAWSRNMVSNEKGLPDSFDPKTGRNIRWTANLGAEHSEPRHAIDIDGEPVVVVVLQPA